MVPWALWTYSGRLPPMRMPLLRSLAMFRSREMPYRSRRRPLGRTFPAPGEWTG